MSTVAGSGHQVAEAPNTLPRHLTTFIGRDSELRSLKGTVRASRLVTLTGTGGSGKTRLATEVARASTEFWPDGIWWIGLEATDDVAGAVIAALELPGVGRGVDVIASWLAARRALLLLDNCEHLIAACAQFAQTLLERCPNLSILATSREPLGVPGEVRWPVSSLDDVDAYQLFEARGQLLLPHFKVSALNHEPVAAICRRLDRLPLAIEMAAARLDLMSESELLANLNDRFGVLSSIARTAPARQQTMAATLDWSYRLLTEDEKRLFRSLAVFQGGFTMQAAEAVCSDAPRTVLPLLSGLVQKSMVVAEKLNDGSTRYRLLESHHAFALEQLQADSGAFDSLRRRHHEHFSNQPWTAVESSNFWFAVSWARDHAQDHGLRIAVEIAESEFSDQARGRKLLIDLLELSGDNSALRARALNLAGRLASRQGDHVNGRKLADESIALARPLQDPELIAQVLNGAGMVYHSAGNPAVSRRMYDEAMGLLKSSPNRRLAIEIQNQLGFIAVEQGEYAPAVPILEECVSYARSVNDRTATARYLESLANAQLGAGNVAEAVASWTEAVPIYRDLNDPFGAIYCLGGLALAAAARGEDERCLRLASAVDRLSREWSLSALAFRVSQLQDAIDRARGRLGRQKGERAWAEGQAMSTAEALDYALGGEPQPQRGVDTGPLSRREAEVAAMVAAGMTNKEIAQRLFIAERTAEGHVERIRNKLGVRSRTEVATWAISRGLAPATVDKTHPRSTV